MTGLPRVLAAALVPLVLAGCDEANMATQDRAQNWDRNAFFEKNSTMLAPVAGTVPRNDPAKPAPQPATIDAALLQHGREQYAIFCTPCHGLSGDGHGMITARGFPAPGSLASERLRNAKASEHYAVISNGKGAMYGLSQQIPSADRWAIVAYVRALQLSQNAETASLEPADRAALEVGR